MKETYIFCYDLHADSKQPGGRIDNWQTTVLEKLKYISNTSIEKEATVVFTGDFFHSPRQEDHEFMGNIHSVLKTFYTIPMTIVGNHDIQYNNMRYLNKSALGELFKAGSMKLLDRFDSDHVSMFGSSFFDRKYLGEKLTDTKKHRILVGHYYHTSMACSNFVNPKEIIEDYDMSQFNISVMGHDHSTYEDYGYSGGVLYRLGSFGRIAADSGNINRDEKVQYLLIEIDDDYIEISRQDVEICKPAEQVFNFEAIQRHTNENYQEISDFVKKFSRLVKGENADLGALADHVLDELDLDPETKESIRSILSEKISENSEALL